MAIHDGLNQSILNGEGPKRMSAFDYVMGLLSVISSLGLVHLASGFVALVREGRKVHWSPPPLIWMWIAFGTTIGNWASYWSMHDQSNWSGWFVVLAVFVALGQYAFCVFVTPAIYGDGGCDLDQFHDVEGKRYIIAFLALVAVSAAQNIAAGVVGNYVFWKRDLVLCAMEGALGLVALSARPRWAQFVAAISIAGIASWFLFATTGISDAAAG